MHGQVGHSLNSYWFWIFQVPPLFALTLPAVTFLTERIRS